ncbi:hypothetical protein STIAU_6034 [Stigmatella aurantiaca DW4/3-1]|uniref:Uncharacterized protein n=1 Tax=Stigmatella aurantiaca (strain DW4/3-1) TaxID=378806 RepID=Q09A93_STIAD|nr:hypothetical protein STIAU_6034 [Stigmatella aurantiaca DW4/3-1]
MAEGAAGHGLLQRHLGQFLVLLAHRLEQRVPAAFLEEGADLVIPDAGQHGVSQHHHVHHLPGCLVLDQAVLELQLLLLHGVLDDDRGGQLGVATGHLGLAIVDGGEVLEIVAHLGEGNLGEEGLKELEELFALGLGALVPVLAYQEARLLLAVHELDGGQVLSVAHGLDHALHGLGDLFSRGGERREGQEKGCQEGDGSGADVHTDPWFLSSESGGFL